MLYYRWPWWNWWEAGSWHVEEEQSQGSTGSNAFPLPTVISWANCNGIESRELTWLFKWEGLWRNSLSMHTEYSAWVNVSDTKQTNWKWCQGNFLPRPNSIRWTTMYWKMLAWMKSEPFNIHYGTVLLLNPYGEKWHTYCQEFLMEVSSFHASHACWGPVLRTFKVISNNEWSLLSAWQQSAWFYWIWRWESPPVSLEIGGWRFLPYIKHWEGHFNPEWTRCGCK